MKTDGVPFWNARSLSQYSSGEMVEFSEDTNFDLAGTQSCTTAFCTSVNPDNYQWTLQNGGSRQGQPFGNLQVSYTHFLDPRKGFSYRPKAFFAKLVKGGATTAQDMADGNATVAGIGFVDASYGLVGTATAQPGDTAYAYCETTFRAMITGVASAVVLGKPTRFYDGAMVEWNSLPHLLDSNGNCILPSNSPWRSDVKSFFRPAASPSLVTPRNVTDPYAFSSNAVVDADRANTTGEAISRRGGGGSAPTNPLWRLIPPGCCILQGLTVRGPFS